MTADAAPTEVAHEERLGVARSLWWWFWFVAWSLAFAAVTWPIALLSPLLGSARFRVIYPLHRLWARVVMAVAFGDRFEASGLEKLPPPDRPVVVVANHQSLIDTVIMHWFPRHLSHVMHRKWIFTPIMGLFMWADGCLLVEVGDADSGARLRDAAVSRLRAGRWVLVYPEGGRWAAEGVGRFRRGAFEIARRAGVGVLPVLIAGSRGFMPKGSLRGGSRIWPHPISLRVFDLIPPEEVAATEPGDLAARTRATLAGAMREDRARRLRDVEKDAL